MWLNDEELLPDEEGTDSGNVVTNEVDLGNENLTARPPKKIKLLKGWNKVLIKLPYVDVEGVRLNKWLFTFVVTDTECRDALSGLIYSPSKYMDNSGQARHF